VQETPSTLGEQCAAVLKQAREANGTLPWSTVAQLIDQTLAAQSASKIAPPRKSDGLTDAEWLQELCLSPAYKGIDVMVQYEKCKVWCANNRAQPTRRRFVNWLNRADRPIDTLTQPRKPLLR
jgi:hypothetical protein